MSTFREYLNQDDKINEDISTLLMDASGYALVIAAAVEFVSGRLDIDGEGVFQRWIIKHKSTSKKKIEAETEKNIKKLPKELKTEIKQFEKELKTLKKFGARGDEVIKRVVKLNKAKEELDKI